MGRPNSSIICINGLVHFSKELMVILVVPIIARTTTEDLEIGKENEHFNSVVLK